MPLDTSIPLQVKTGGFDPLRSLAQLAQLSNLGQEGQLNQLQQVRAQQEIAQHQRQMMLAERQLREREVARQAYVDSDGDLDKTIGVLRQKGASLETIMGFESHKEKLLDAAAKRAHEAFPGQQDRDEKLATLLDEAFNDPDYEKKYPLYAGRATFLDPTLKDKLPATPLPKDELKILGLGFKTQKYLTDAATRKRTEELHPPALAEAQQKAADLRREANATRLAGILRTQGPAAYNLAVSSLPAAEQEGFKGLMAEKDVLAQGRTPQEISAGYQAAMPQQAEDWIAIANDPNAPPERKQYAKSVVDAIEKYKIATQPPPTALLLPPDVEAQRIRMALAAAEARAEAAPATEAENRSLGFFERADAADKNLAALESEIAEKSTIGMAWLQRAPNWMQSESNQQYQQARRQFIEAYLRRDSGAVIGPNEYADADRTYFPQPGDSPQVLKDKAAQRKVVLEGLKTSSGRAYKRKYGEPADQQPPHTIELNGKHYRYKGSGATDDLSNYTEVPR